MEKLVTLPARVIPGTCTILHMLVQAPTWSSEGIVGGTAGVGISTFDRSLCAGLEHTKCKRILCAAIILARKQLICSSHNSIRELIDKPSYL
jgi:hypothetical protein